MLNLLLQAAGTTGVEDPRSWLLLAPEIMVLLGILSVPFVGFVLKDVRVRQEVALLAIVGALLAVFLLLSPRGLVMVGLDPDATPVLFGLYEINAFALFFKAVFLIVALLIVLASPTAMKPARANTEYYTLLLVAIFGMMVVASGRDLLTIFVGLETTALATYVLAGYRKTQAASIEAATKFIVIGALATGLTLYGISLIYASTGTVDLYELRDILGSGDVGPGLFLAVGFLLAGFGFKASMVPFHVWAPDVYHGAPDTVSALLAAGSKKMGLAAFFKVFFVGLIAVKFQWDVLVGILAILTMTLGNLVALRQTSIKRLLAWSSIAQAGYMLIAFPVGTQLALTGAFFHVLTHAVMKGGAFILVAVLATRGIGENLDDWRGLHRKSPPIAFAMALLMLSMAGIPPLAGFASKFVLFASAIDAGIDLDAPALVWLAVAGILNSVLSLGYYVRVVRTMYVDEESPPAVVPAPLDFRAPVWAAVALILVGVLLMGIWPQPFIDLAQRAAAAILF